MYIFRVVASRKSHFDISRSIEAVVDDHLEIIILWCINYYLCPICRRIQTRFAPIRNVAWPFQFPRASCVRLAFVGWKARRVTISTVTGPHMNVMVAELRRVTGKPRCKEFLNVTRSCDIIRFQCRITWVNSYSFRPPYRYVLYPVDIHIYGQACPYRWVHTDIKYTDPPRKSITYRTCIYIRRCTQSDRIPFVWGVSDIPWVLNSYQWSIRNYTFI